jgi:hypothetical protein
LGIISGTAAATQVALDINNPQNGITEIYSATFDGALDPCTNPAAPPYCSFFNGFPPLSPPDVRAIEIDPNPTGVINGIPAGFIPTPPAGSYLNLTLDAGHQNVTISGGVVRFPDPIHIVILDSTFVTANGAGIVLNTTPQMTSVDANGVAEFLVEMAPAVAADFSTFTEIVEGPWDGSSPPLGCSGPQCVLIPILTLDMVRYRLLIDYDPTFTSFTASFIGQTANNSVLSATVNSIVPSNVVVTDSIAPPGDHALPFGNVIEGQTVSATVTVSAEGTAPLVIGQIGGVDLPFAVANDTCSNQTVAPGDNCTFEIQFQPAVVGPVSDTLDIPSDDPDDPTVTLNVSGNGIPQFTPDIRVTDAADPVDDLRFGFRNVLMSEPADTPITVTNDGDADLVIGTVGQSLAAPFSIFADGCSNQSIAPAASCTITVRFAPDAIDDFSDSFDIPSNDPDEAVVMVSLSGDGGTSLIVPTPDGADSGFMALDPLTLLGLSLFGMAGRARRKIH